MPFIKKCKHNENDEIVGVSQIRKKIKRETEELFTGEIRFKGMRIKEGVMLTKHCTVCEQNYIVEDWDSKIGDFYFIPASIK